MEFGNGTAHPRGSDQQPGAHQTPFHISLPNATLTSGSALQAAVDHHDLMPEATLPPRLTTTTAAPPHLPRASMAPIPAAPAAIGTNHIIKDPWLGPLNSYPAGSALPSYNGSSNVRPVAPPVARQAPLSSAFRGPFVKIKREEVLPAVGSSPIAPSRHATWQPLPVDAKTPAMSPVIKSEPGVNGVAEAAITSMGVPNGDDAIINELPPVTAAAGNEVPAPPAVATAVPRGPILGSQYLEQQHKKKMQWISGKDLTTGQLRIIAVTLTSSDVSTGRMRPPREWYCSLINSKSPTNSVTRPSGAVSQYLLASLVQSSSTSAGTTPAVPAVGISDQGMGTEVVPPLVPSAVPRSIPSSALGEHYYLTVTTYDKYPTEYYVQGSGVKRMYKDLKVQPGDMIKMKSEGWDPQGRGHPVVSVELVPRGENPYAESVLQPRPKRPSKPKAPRAPKAAAASRRPPAPAGSRKKKFKPVRADAGDGGFDYFDSFEAMGAGAMPLGEEEAMGGSRSRRATSRFHHSEFVEDFETDEDDYIPSEYSEGDGTFDEEEEEEESLGPSAQATLAPSTSQGRGGSSVEQGLKEELERVLEERNNPPGPLFAAPGLAARGPLKVKLNLPPQQERATGQQQHPSTQQAQHGPESVPQALHMQQKQDSKPENGIHHEHHQGPPTQDPLAMLAGLAEGAFASSLASPPSAPSPRAPSKSSLVTLSRSLLRNEAGLVAGVRLKLHWPVGSREPAEISRNLCEFGQQHASVVEVDDMQLNLEQCFVEVVLRLTQAGQVGPLEATIAKLLQDV